VRRLIVKSGRVTGIELADVTYRAEAEVLLCAGGLGSARLLMLSGIGPADHLRDVGVNVVHDLPGVGSALQDHFVIDIICQLKDTETLNRYDKPHWMAWAGLQWALFGTGPATSNVAEGGAFWRSSQTTDVPDLQFHFLPGVGAEAGVTGLSSGVGATLNAYFVRPLSRGSLRLRSADPQDKPLLDPNYLAEPGDVAGSIDAVEVSREIMRQPAFTDVMKAEVEPGAKATSRADLEDYVRQNGRTGYHPVGTCRMGSDDMAVVSPDLRLRGLDGLRVCDSSVMPSIVGSNTNAPTVMIAERAADLVRGNRIPA
jgi:choline dehydrogenase-like flavoprotein